MLSASRRGRAPRSGGPVGPVPTTRRPLLRVVALSLAALGLIAGPTVPGAFAGPVDTSTDIDSPTPLESPAPAPDARSAERDGSGDAPESNEWRRIVFPVEGRVSYYDDFGNCRDGCRRYHEGNDLMGTKLQKLRSTVDGTVVWVRNDSAGNAGNMVTIADRDGWQYRYIHVNNDTPGTDDGANPPEWRFAPGIAVGAKVKAGQFIGYLGDSGNAENSSPHLHFEIRRPDGSALNPYVSLRLAQGLPAGGYCGYPANPTVRPSAAAGRGYWAVLPDGGVLTFGGARYFGSLEGRARTPIVGMATTPSGAGYWLVDSEGAVFAFGDARRLGSMKGTRLSAPIIGMAATPDGKGYWLLGRDGGIFSFGNARFHGSTGAMRLNAPVIQMTPTPDGGGYWLLGGDGGIFTFGNARFHGSTGAMRLAAPVVAMAATPDGKGYWLLGGDGGMFTFGGARFAGSLPGRGRCEPIPVLSLAASLTGGGYWVLRADGKVESFGDARHYGNPSSLGVRPAALAVVPGRPDPLSR